RLKPVEFRRGRRHVGIGFSRGAVGLGGSATEIVGVGGDVAEAAHARRRRRLRTRSAGRRRIGALVARLALFILAKRRTGLARGGLSGWTRALPTGRSGRSARWA